MSFLSNIEDMTSNDNMTHKSSISETKDQLKTLVDILIEIHNGKTEWFSKNLDKKITDLQLKFYEPMKVAIIGQFSSGKSTFLNALLSNDILPSGINPVTSKINYIKYGNEIKLEVSFKDGREQLFDVSSITSFTDQRNKNNIDDIDYLTLYYPLEILKEITFVDTPGLNSVSDIDTKTTESILSSVDAIIWVTLIDNAAKNSEKVIVEKIIKNYSSKSLCIINQKDKIDDEDDLEDVIEYVHNEFDDFFMQIEAISSKQALDARSNSKEILTIDLFNAFTHDLNKDLKQIINDSHLYNIQEISEIISQQSKNMAEGLQNIKTQDISKNEDLLKESNISSVLDFINKEIKPQHTQSKLFSIKNKMRVIAHSMIDQNNIFINVLKDLITVITVYDKKSSDKFDQYLNTYIKQANEKLSDDINNIIHESHKAIMDAWTSFENTKITSAIDKGIIYDSEKVVYEEYDSAFIDNAKVNDYIKDDKFQSLISQYHDNLDNIDENISRTFRDIYKMLENDINLWMKRSLDNLKISDHLHSEKSALLFNNMFISNKFEIILNSFENDIEAAINDIELNLKHLSIAIGWNYNSSIYATTGHISNIISVNEFAYEKNNEKFNLPCRDDVQDTLNDYFSKDQLIGFVSDDNGIFLNSINFINNQHTEVANAQIEVINDCINGFTKENKKLQDFIENLDNSPIKTEKTSTPEPVFICSEPYSP